MSQCINFPIRKTFRYSEMEEKLNKCRSQTDLQINGVLNRDALPHRRMVVYIIITEQTYRIYSWMNMKSFFMKVSHSDMKQPWKQINLSNLLAVINISILSDQS